MNPIVAKAEFAAASAAAAFAVVGADGNVRTLAAVVMIEIIAASAIRSLLSFLSPAGPKC